MKITKILFAAAITLLAAATPTATPQPPITPTTLHKFAAQLRAGFGPMIQAPDGTLFGVMESGGVGDFGAVFVVSPQPGGGYAFSILHQFTGVDGANPRGLTYHLPTDTLYGVTASGGVNGPLYDGLGTVFSLTRAGVLTTLQDFDFEFSVPQPLNPQAALLLASDGNFYGTASGATTVPGSGAIFSMTPAGDLELLHTFSGSDGSNPSAQLVEGTDGFLYGTTTFGGTHDTGTVFKIRKDGTDFQTLHQFDATNPGGNQPRGLTLDTSGGSDVLYGLTAGGGPDSRGTVFTISPSGTFSLRASFTVTGGQALDGAYPTGALVKAADGLFYGSTEAEGPTPFGSLGTVFSFDPATDTIAVVHDYTSDFLTGVGSNAGLMVAADGSLLGTTTRGGAHRVGTVFHVDISTSPQTVTKVVDVPSLGPAQPQDRLFRASNGVLYGTTVIGGDFNSGTIIRVNADGSVTQLHSFNFIDGHLPSGELVEGSDGNLWGATTYGGNVQFSGDFGGGTIFRIAKDGTNFTVVFRFANYAVEGAHPLAGLVEGPDGNFYGTTHQNGPNLAGTVFKVTPSGALTTLHGFGAWSLTRSTLVIGEDGYFYGATREGGTNPNGGTLYKIDSNGNFVQLYEFTDPATGAHPNGLILGTDGNLYGTTEHGGTFSGTLFRLTPAGGFTLLHAFEPSVDGANPTATPLEAGDGTLYGQTWFAGPLPGVPFTGLGTLYSYDGAGVQHLHTFDQRTLGPGGPYAGLTQGTDNLLYGLTQYLQGGAVYSFDQGITNKAPVARHQRIAAGPGEPAAVNLVASDPDGNPLAFSVVGQPANGTVSGSGPSYVYEPNPGFNGTDFFYVRVNDGTVSSPVAGVMVTVGAANAAPIANDQSVILDEDTSTSITLTGSDPDGSAVSFTVVTPPAHGALSGTAPNLTYTPVPDYNGPDSFTFRVNDGTVDSNIATISITVGPANTPPVVFAQSVSVIANTATPILLGASDANGDPLTFFVVTQPTHGVVSGSAPNLIYTPDTNYVGGDTFTFNVNDGTVDGTGGTVTITVTAPANRPPASNAGGPYTGDLGAPVTLDGSGTTDPDLPFGDTLFYFWTITTATGPVTYSGGPVLEVPSAQVTQAIGLGTFPVALRVSDGAGLEHTAHTTLTVRGPVAAFTATPNPAACGQSVTFDASGSDNTRPGRTIVAYVFAFGDGTGAASRIAMHSYPQYGNYQAELIVTDDRGITASSQQTISINQGNQPPTAAAGGPYTVLAGNGVSFDGTGSQDPNSSCGDSIVSYQWMVNGAILLAGATPSLTVGQVLAIGPGTFPVQLTVTDTFGATGTASTTLTVQTPAIATTTEIQASLTTAGALEPVRLVATVAPVAPGTGVPGGDVEFVVNGTLVIGVGPLVGGVASISSNAGLVAGVYSLSARYLGAPPFTGSTSAPVSLTVRPLAESTFTLLIPWTNPRALGQPAVISAVVLALAGGTLPTGTVEFFDGSTPLGIAPISGGLATLVWTPPTAGTLTIQARYLGNASFASSTSQPVMMTIHTGATPVATAITFAVTPSPSTLGQPVTFTATVTGPGAPGGVVTFFSDGGVLGTGTVNSVGGILRATFTTSALPAGARVVSASYGGSPGFAASNAAAVFLVINP